MVGKKKKIGVMSPLARGKGDEHKRTRCSWLWSTAVLFDADLSVNHVKKRTKLWCEGGPERELTKLKKKDKTKCHFTKSSLKQIKSMCYPIQEK